MSPTAQSCFKALTTLARAPRIGVGDTPPFLLTWLDDLAQREAAGTVRRCRHLRAGGLPHALACQPGRLRCAACLPEALARLEGTRSNHDCDACGSLAERLYVTTAMARGIAVTFGACGYCELSGQVRP